MASTIRSRLAFFYTGIMAISLLGFILISYFSLSALILKEQKQEVLQLAVNEALTHKEWIRREAEADVKARHLKPEELQRSVVVNGNTFFFLVTASGKVLNQNEPNEIQQMILDHVKDWKREYSDIIRITLDSGETIPLVIAAYPIVDNQQQIGVFYAGKNIAAYYYFFDRMVLVLSLSAFGFMLFIAGAGYFLAGRAIMPIERSLARQRQFVDDASHELRTPLSAIQASIDVLETEVRKDLSVFSCQLLDDLKTEVRRLSRSVGNMLTLARADSNTIEINSEFFDFVPEAERVVRSFQAIADDNGILITFNAPQNIPVYGDQERLTQLLFILIDNALKYTLPGGEITVKLAFSEQTAMEGLRFSVEDTGVGISEDDCRHIFGRFYRVDKARSRKTGGTGLGLAIAAWIVEAHGGSIKVNSILGKGSIFSVFIPGAKKEK